MVKRDRRLIGRLCECGLVLFARRDKMAEKVKKHKANSVLHAASFAWADYVWKKRQNYLKGSHEQR